MANLGMNFDASTVNPQSDWEPIPAGEYPVQVVSSEMCDTKDGRGRYLKLEMQIIEGEYAGRSHYERLNLSNPNQQAVEISQRSLSAICHATGKMTINDSEELHYIPILAVIKVKPRKDDNTRFENVASYKALGQHQPPQRPAQQRPAPTQQAAPAPSGVKSPPWRKSA